LQQKQLTGSVDEQNTLLKVTKGKESAYQAELSDTQKEAAAIKNRLYQLLEVSKQITFGQAVTIAQWASGQTGVRAAFLLAILTQESSLGANVGTCNRAGDPPSKSWRVVMKPDRDQAPFKQITAELGLPIDTTPVSCPMRDKSGNQVGWGGAMGPAQFIPSTWMGYRAKVTAVTGKAANPWDIRDAFLAAAIKLKADGAGSQSGEWAAAMKYFSGGTNPAYRFYGDNVATLAAGYESDIEKLK
jgi:membrane-bound lytic murein transglycosylase B